MSEASEFRHLVRISGKDLAGGKKLIAALSDLRGVGYNFANVITTKLSLDPSARLGTLSEEQVKQIEAAIGFFSQTEDWEQLLRNAMMADFSWERSAEAYLQLYRKAVEKKR